MIDRGLGGGGGEGDEGGCCFQVPIVSLAMALAAVAAQLWQPA